MFAKGDFSVVSTPFAPIANLSTDGKHLNQPQLTNYADNFHECIMARTHRMGKLLSTGLATASTLIC